jgi:hypothetical protein
MLSKNNIPAISLTRERDFVWVAEYLNGSWLSEFDGFKWNDFYSIDRSKLLNFGFIGHQNRLFFRSNGQFVLNGIPVDFHYVTNNTTYYLTSRNMYYNDIIQYKDAAANINFSSSGWANSSILRYNFGYKIPLCINGVNMEMRILCIIPRDSSVYFSVRLVSSINMDGELVVVMGGQNVFSNKIPLIKNISNEIICRW